MRSSRQGLETEHARKERHGESERVRHAPLAAAITVDLGRDHLCWPPPAVARPAARPSSTSPLSVSRTQAASAGSPRHALRGKSATVPSGAVERGGEGGPPGKQSRRRAARRRPLGCIPRRAPQHTRCTCAARACGGRTRRRRGSSLRTRRGSELRDSEQAGQSSIARRSYRAYLHLTPSHLTPPLSTLFVVLVCMYNVGMYTERERETGLREGV